MIRQSKQCEEAGSSLSGTPRTRILYLLIAVLAVAFWLRVWGIGFGLPYDLTYDEPHEILRALKLGAGEYYWESSGKGGLYYLLFIEYAVLYVVWWIMGWVRDTRDFALSFIQDPSAFYLAGRVTVAFLGTLTCLVVFLVGQRVYDWRVGLGAAFIGATAYQHTVSSHFINVDIGLTLALWTSLWMYLEYEEKGQWRWLIAAGALGGIAIAHKTPGAIIILPLLIAIGSHASKQRDLTQMLKEAGIVLSVMLVTLILIAPEWMVHPGIQYRHFSRLLGYKEIPIDDGNDLRYAPYTLGMVRDNSKEWTTYLKILFHDYNIGLTLSAFLGAMLGIWRRHRWDIVWSVLIIAFLGIMTAADRSALERYLLPIMPALWLLGSRAIVMLSGRRWWLIAAGLGCVVVLPLIAVIRQDYEWTKPDTRVLAKEWIEAHIPSGAKILMDGMRYRFVQSPPLHPDKSTIARRVTRGGKEGEYLSRGVSQQALALYARAAGQVDGPTYALYSTVWGHAVKDPAYYVQTCFEYIITSSYVTDKYTSGRDRARSLHGTRFYEQLNTDSRFQKVYTIAPVPWQRGGPTITVYKIVPTCEASQDGTDRLSKW